MKKCILTFVLGFFALYSFSQSQGKNLSVNLGPEIGVATGAFGDTHGLGLGASIQAELVLSQNLTGTAYFGIINYFGKSIASGITYKNGQVYPLRVGAKYFLIPNFLHVGGQIGFGIVSFTGSNSGFAYSPQAGIRVGDNWDATIKYDAVSISGGTIGSFGIRIAYYLGGGK
jgi:hypothetical protein